MADINTSFGCNNTRNNNFRVEGSENVGTIEHNNNLKLNAFQCTLKLLKNANLKLDAKFTTLSCINTQNCKISGDKNQLEIEDESNLKLQGNNNKIKNVNNSNVKIAGDNIVACFSKNRNLKVDGSNCLLNAVRNCNLAISGNNSDLSIADTYNHFLRHVQSPGDVERNKVHLSWGGETTPSGNRMMSILSYFSGNGGGWVGNSRNVDYSIEYAKKAEIKSDRYSLGIFKFQMKESDALAGSKVSINFDRKELQDLQVASKDSRSVVVSASCNGVKGVLEIIGPEIRKEADNDKLILDVSILPPTSNY